MDYPTFVVRHLPIGSSAVESACTILIEEREKGARMRLTKTDAQAVASLRPLWRSGRWKTYWVTHPQCRRLSVMRRAQTSETLEQVI
jgi:hypothetical protein